jgi:DNA-binding PadR family transcriptional regulator
LVSNWMLERFRSDWLLANLPLLVLKLLQESTMSEWEILSRLHERFELYPSAHEFGRLEKSLLGKGYVSLERVPGGGKLQITTEGVRLLRRIEAEYRAVLTNAPRSTVAT